MLLCVLQRLRVECGSRFWISDAGFRPGSFQAGALQLTSAPACPLILAVSLSEYILLAGSSLFVIIDPLAAVPAFLAMTPNDTPAQRLRTARVACGTVAGVLLAFAAAGSVIFKIFSITMPAFQMAASIVLLIVALDMLRVQRSRVQETHEEKQAGTAKDDIAVTPLAIPMLAGPGAISTTILLQNQARTIPQHLALTAALWRWRWRATWFSGWRCVAPAG